MKTEDIVQQVQRLKELEGHHVEKMKSILLLIDAYRSEKYSKEGALNHVYNEIREHLNLTGNL